MLGLRKCRQCLRDKIEPSKFYKKPRTCRACEWIHTHPKLDSERTLTVAYATVAAIDSGDCSMCGIRSATWVYDSCTGSNVQTYIVMPNETLAHVVSRAWDMTPVCDHCFNNHLGRPIDRTRCTPPPLANNWPSLAERLLSSPRADEYGELFAQADVEVADITRRVPEPVPTMALPGTREKVEVLRERFARGESLFADADERTLPERDLDIVGMAHQEEHAGLGIIALSRPSIHSIKRVKEHRGQFKKQGKARRTGTEGFSVRDLFISMSPWATV